MSAPETTLATLRADVVELAALRAGSAQLASAAAARGIALPECGAASLGSAAVTLSVRPGRWLLVTSPTAAGASAALWQGIADGGCVIDQSSGLAALHLAGPAVRTLLARGCRLDLDPGCFPAGRAAATIMAQVSTVLAALPSGMLILTPSSTAQHLSEWLTASARPFGPLRRAELTLAEMLGDRKA